jgi:heme-degrading monooxygenase HmoA
MVGVFVTFRYENGADAAKIRQIAESARKQFEGMPGLRSKAFTLDEEGGSATNVYIWDSEEAARAFFTDEMRERVTGLYGVPPTIRFAEIAALVDNS